MTLGRHHYFYMKKFGKNSQLGLTPPDNSEMFEFQNYLKKEHIDGGRPPPTDIWKGLSRPIEKGYI